MDVKNPKSTGELAEYLGIPCEGDTSIKITGFSGIQDAKPGDITFLSDPKFANYLSTTEASAIIINRETDKSGLNIPVLISENPYLSFVKIVELFTSGRHPAPHIHEKACIAEDARLGIDIFVGANAFIGKNCTLGDGCIIYPSVYIGNNCRIGARTIIYPNASILADTEIGSDVIIHSGTVVGSDGYGFINMNGVHEKIPQVGKVVIEDNVEIGANVTIDRATLDETRICRGTKIDNLVHIAHNVRIGENSLIIAQVGISGSTEIGKNVTLAGQVGLVGHIKIGDGSIIGSQSGVNKSLPPNSIYSGSPAIDHRKWLKMVVSMPKIVDLLKKVKELEKKINELDNR